MFEDFSFSSPRPPRLAFDGDDRLMVDGDSTLVSPLSSRCPSPRSFASSSSQSQSQSQPQRFPRTVRSSLQLRMQPHFQPQPQPPTSVPFAFDNRRLSIGTLTKKLHEHTLQNPEECYYHGHTHAPGHGQVHTQEDACVSPRSVPDLVPGSAARLPGYFLTPPDTDHDEEGYGGDEADYFFSSVRTSPSVASHPQTPFLCPTSVPPSPGDGSTTGSTGAGGGQDIRTQRQNISQIQCNASDIETIRRALLSSEDDSHIDPFGQDEYHPSSLPPRRSPRRRAATLNRSRSRPVLASGEGTTASAPEQQQQQQQHYRGRRKSSSGALMSPFSSSHRIDKSYYPPSSRELRKKSEQGLRRKSLVSAALASMVEKSL